MDEDYFFQIEDEITDDRLFILIIYDITNNSKRVKFAKLLLGYGFRIQKSAFEAVLTKTKYEKLKQEISGQSVILFHEAYAYVAEDYGLQVNYLLDLDEERQVSAGEVSDVLSAVRKGHVKYILAEELYGKSMGDTIRKESDAKVLYLDPLNRGTYEKDSYINGMKKNMEILEEAFYAKDH